MPNFKTLEYKSRDKTNNGRSKSSSLNPQRNNDERNCIFKN